MAKADSNGKISRREFLSLRVTEEEKEEIKSIADSHQQDVSTFLRESALKRKKK